MSVDPQSFPGFLDELAYRGRTGFRAVTGEIARAAGIVVQRRQFVDQFSG